jgi:hypothetical protein
VSGRRLGTGGLPSQATGAALIIYPILHRQSRFPSRLYLVHSEVPRRRYRSLNRPLPIVLVETKTGTRTIVESFTDGSFYRMGLRPGRYQATVEDGVLRQMGLVADTLRFELQPGRSAAEPGPMLSDLRLMLRPRDTSAEL